MATSVMGCAEDPEPVSVGQISVPLTASSTTGAVYRLPPGTSLALVSDALFTSFSLDGDTPSVTVNVPARQYAVQLLKDGAFTTVWPLTRLNPNGTTETVQSTLDPIPAITVTENQTTALAIRFHVAGSGVTFQNGSVQVTVEVDDLAATTPFEVTIDLPALTTTLAQPGDAAPPQLASRLPALGSTGQHYRVVAQTTGPWAISGLATICAPVTYGFDAGGHAQFTDLLVEATQPSDVEVCISQLEPDHVAVVLNFFRFGTPTTTLLSDLTTHELGALYVVQADIPMNLFDGTALHLDRLAGTRSGTGFLFSDLQVIGDDGAFERWFDLEEDGDATLTVTQL